jgi:hypothetical protein
MTEFPALREALHAWMLEATAALVDDPDAAYEGLGTPGWRCDPDGIFRNIARLMDAWDFRKLRQFQQLSSWPDVDKVFHEDSRLSCQVDTVMGTVHSGMRIEAYNYAVHLIPRPSELHRVEEVFEQRYTELEAYLLAVEFEFKTLWPVPGLILGDTPIELEPGVVLDVMSDHELVMALRTDIARPVFANSPLFQADRADRTCFRYRYPLPKLIGPREDEMHARSEELEQRLQAVGATIEESLALVLPEPVMPAGRFGISGEQWYPQSGGVAFRETMMPRHARWRRIELNAQHLSELQEVWKLVSQRGLLTRHKGLALALRRLSYQAQRERPDDELLDIMIAAEALYFTERGRQQDRGELRYRLALRAAIWADEQKLGMTKPEVLKLIKVAYDARSAVAHGGSPDPKEMKIKGERVELSELVKVTRIVVAQGCRRALAASAAASGTGWPPEWDAVILG